MAGRWYILGDTSTESIGSRNVLENCRKKLRYARVRESEVLGNVMESLISANTEYPFRYFIYRFNVGHINMVGRYSPTMFR